MLWMNLLKHPSSIIEWNRHIKPICIGTTLITLALLFYGGTVATYEFKGLWSAYVVALLIILCFKPTVLKYRFLTVFGCTLSIVSLVYLTAFFLEVMTPLMTLPNDATISLFIPILRHAFILIIVFSLLMYSYIWVDKRDKWLRSRWFFILYISIAALIVTFFIYYGYSIFLERWERES